MSLTVEWKQAASASGASASLPDLTPAPPTAPGVTARAEPVKLAPAGRPAAEPDGSSLTEPARPIDRSVRRSGDLLPKHQATTER